MIAPEKLQGIVDKFEGIERQLGDPGIVRDPKKLQALSREHARLREIVEVARQFQKAHADLEGVRELARTSDDADLRALARQEAEELQQRHAALESKLEILLVPPDPLAEKNVIVEIRAGTG